MAEIEEKVFHHFRKISPKIRMMVTNEMEPADRCRLTRCSKLCDEEAKASKNYIYELTILYSIEVMRIDVVHRRHGQIENNGYMLVFDCENNKKLYKNLRYETLWETEVDSSQLAFEEVKSIIRKYQRNIRELGMYVILDNEYTEKRRFVDFGIESLDSLERLYIGGDFDFRNILSKTRKPLKTLSIHQYENKDIILHKAIYQVQENLTWLGPKFDNQQFLQLSAKRVEISIGKLTERDIFNFIRSWQDGTIGKDIVDYSWSLSSSEFSKQKLLKLLRNNGQREPLGIKHFEETGKYAKLFISALSIQFVVQQ